MKPSFNTMAVTLAASLCVATALPTAVAQNAASESTRAAADATQAAKAPGPKDAAEQTDKIAAALKRDEGSASKDVTVSAHAGTIVLGGKVDTEADKARASNTAEAAADGTRVSNYVEVRPAEQVARQPDQKLTRDVEQALRRDLRTSTLSIVVSNDEHNVVMLNGLVPSKDERSAAESVAKRVPGVARVDNHLALPGK